MTVLPTIASRGDASPLQQLVRDIGQFGAAPALISVRGEATDVWSFETLADLTQRLAAGLARAGVTPGEPVLLFGPNSPQWVVVRLALAAMGALAVSIDDLSSAEEAAVALADAGCLRAFASRAHVPTLRATETGDRLTIHLFDDGNAVDGSAVDGAESWRALLADTSEPLPPLHAEAPASLVQTSGTTGPPRSFVLTGANIWSNVAPLVETGLVGPGDRVLLPLPLHHVYPFVVGLLVPLAAGAAVVMPEAVSGPQLVQALKLGKATTIIGVPRLFAALEAGITARVAARGPLVRGAFGALVALAGWLRCRLGWRVGPWLFRGMRAQLGGDLRLLISGGAKLDLALARRLEALGWTVRSGYGLAETASIFTGNLPGAERRGSVGRPFQGGAVRIDAPDAEGVGEILLRGPNVCAGYRHNLQADRDAFTEDGWLSTGDLGRLDADGYLFVEGRAKELIVLGGGKKVFAEALEAIYLEACPHIKEIGVFEQGGALHALALPDADAIRATGTTRVEDAVRVALAGALQGLPSHQRLAGYAMVRHPLPRTRLGKVRRFLLPALYERARGGAHARAPAELSAADRALLDRPLPKALWQFLEGRYTDMPQDLDASLQLDLGIDSLEWITLSLELERALKVQLSEAEIADIHSLRDLIAAIEAADGRSAAAPVDPLGVPELADAAHWTAPPSLGERIVGNALAYVNRLLLWTFFSLRAVGRENLPARGPLLIVANHVSDLDPMSMGAALPMPLLRRTYWSGDISRLFATPRQRWFARAFHIFPIDERAPAASLAMAAAVLRSGGALVWFPEAWRSATGEVQAFRPGIGALVAETQAPVVPAFIHGAFEAMPRWAHRPRLFRPIRVRFGPLRDAATLAAGSEGTAPERITAKLHDALIALGREG